MKVRLTEKNLHFLAECIKTETIASSLCVLNEQNIRSILEMEDRHIVERYLNEISGATAAVAPIVRGMAQLVLNNIGKLSIALAGGLTAMLGQRTDVAIKQGQAMKAAALQRAMGESTTLTEENGGEAVKASLDSIKEIKNSTVTNKSQFEELFRKGEYKQAITYLKNMIRDLGALIKIKVRHNLPVKFDLPNEFLSTSLMWLSLAGAGVIAAKLLVPVGRKILRFFSGQYPDEAKDFSDKAKNYMSNIKDKAQ